MDEERKKKLDRKFKLFKLQFGLENLSKDEEEYYRTFLEASCTNDYVCNNCGHVEEDTIDKVKECAKCGSRDVFATGPSNIEKYIDKLEKLGEKLGGEYDPFESNFPPIVTGSLISTFLDLVRKLLVGQPRNLDN